MRKHRKLLIAVPCLAVVAAIAVFATGDDEPTYEGRPLSVLIKAPYFRSTADPKFNASFAIREIGTNALPCLLKWLRYEPSQLQRAVRSNAPPALCATAFGKYALGLSKEERALFAPLGFRVLGTNAIPAIPQLLAMAKDSSHPQVAVRSRGALTLLFMELASTNDRYRFLFNPEKRDPSSTDLDVLYREMLRFASLLSWSPTPPFRASTTRPALSPKDLSF